jgi:hypothetical protein
MLAPEMKVWFAAARMPSISSTTGIAVCARRLYQNERHTGVGRHMAEECAECFEPAGGRTDADYELLRGPSGA